MKKEFVKPTTDLPPVTFSPSKFGTYTVSAVFLGVGIGLVSHATLISLIPGLLGSFGLLLSYATREEY